MKKYTALLLALLLILSLTACGQTEDTENLGRGRKLISRRLCRAGDTGRAGTGGGQPDGIRQLPRGLSHRRL
ncbi:MAG: hypothetical protein BHW35_07195 [Firmicutes bacterium CAG:176_63_11]|nr:MAG: hypothetical protein BHW35_07195 [Firmicutes bacterium CAG:176_63_11]